MKRIGKFIWRAALVWCALYAAAQLVGHGAR